MTDTPPEMSALEAADWIGLAMEEWVGLDADCEEDSHGNSQQAWFDATVRGTRIRVSVEVLPQ
jgi:hypothetical protein